MVSIVLIPVVAVIILIYLTNEKIRFINERKASKKLNAKVVSYISEKGPMRNDHTMLEYPYVKIGSDEDSIPRKLKFANNITRSFELDEEINVFWSGTDLLYWNAYDKGLYKYLPEKWKFWE
ncbi:MAG: hypothetical protein Aureis2KO_29130 [Aureisphaera sp.]